MVESRGKKRSYLLNRVDALRGPFEMRVPGNKGRRRNRYIHVLALPNRIDPANLVRKDSERDRDMVLDHLFSFLLKEKPRDMLVVVYHASLKIIATPFGCVHVYIYVYI